MLLNNSISYKLLKGNALTNSRSIINALIILFLLLTALRIIHLTSIALKKNITTALVNCIIWLILSSLS